MRKKKCEGGGVMKGKIDSKKDEGKGGGNDGNGGGDALDGGGNRMLQSVHFKIIHRKAWIDG